MVHKLILSLSAFVCLFYLTPSANVGPIADHTCYQEGLLRDQNFDLQDVNTDFKAYPYPREEIDQALYYAEDHWLIYLNLISTCFKEDNFYMNNYTDAGYYKVKSVCDTRRVLVHAVNAPYNQVCYVVRPADQKIYYSVCDGVCNLGYDGVTGYHCIPKGFTTRNFLAYCRYPSVGNTQVKQPLYAIDPRINDFYDPLQSYETYRMRTVLVDGHQFKGVGYFTQLNVTLPTYCGCRGYFCY